MKQTKHIIILLSTLVAVLTGCEKYLAVNPDNRVRLSTVEDYQAVITGAYPQAYHLFTELYTENVRYYHYPDYNHANITSWLRPLYLWSDNYILNNAITPEAAWRKYYNNIYEANVVLEGVDQASGDDALRRSVKGEAYMNRAYCHFMLVNIFAKHYHSATAATDLGIPYVAETEKEPGRSYKRDNVQFVYDHIEADAKKGLELINEGFMKAPKFHWSRASIHAFLSRFYLFKGDWEQSLFHSEEVFKLNNSIRDLFSDYDQYFAVGDYTTFARRYFETHNTNILLVNYTLEWNSYFRGSLYANAFRETFHPNDVRGKIYTRWNNQTPNYMARKFRGQLPSDGQSYSDVALFVVEEVMYNAAEAAVRKENPDFQYAIDLLNQILQRRWRPYVALDLADYPTEQALLDKILDEKNWELCYEGHRWFDVKRYDIPVTHWDGTREIHLPPGDPRRVVQIPFAELDANPEMEPNPR
ncbi:SusD family protein [Parapedobacter composti]|uniref:SusD family protein n=1 Tax=Parapedobacter composti TaxID=623281 RepID=A0A1I1DSQ9_9SPHI|nr:RagB/SusD family nutrient uptake outer membrane protein [Parapedobacter composti]SFB77931.1 SusD family protein [Parapedobacter composti]